MEQPLLHVLVLVRHDRAKTEWATQASPERTAAAAGETEANVKLPLSVERDSVGRYYVADADGDPVCECWVDQDSFELVRIVNTFFRLVAEDFRLVAEDVTRQEDE